MEQVTCRKCKKQFVPDFNFDFYQDDVDGPGTGLCERCMMNAAFNADPVPVSNLEWTDTVCKKGQGPDCCIFLSVRCEPGQIPFQCAKHSGLNNMLVEKAMEGRLGSQSCNCEGPPSFEAKETPFRYPHYKKE